MNNDIRNLSKWLNEEQEAPIDRQALARVLAMAEQPAPVQEPVAWVEGEEIYWHNAPDLNDWIRQNGRPLVYGDTSPPTLSLAQRKPLSAGNMPPEVDEMRKAALELGDWLSAALDDKYVCLEYKQAINNWFNCAMPYPPAPVAEPRKQEPVAYVVTTEVHGQMCSFIHRSDLTKLLPDGAKLYLTPPAAQRQWVGLTDEQIEREWQFLHDEEGNPPDHYEFARAIEAAHGIKGAA